VFSIAGSIHQLTPDRIVQGGTIETGNATRIISREGMARSPVLTRFGIRGEATNTAQFISLWKQEWKQSEPRINIVSLDKLFQTAWATLVTCEINAASL